MKVATGLARGRTADPALAAKAVRAAMESAGLDHPQAVLLYLTSDFAQDPRAAMAAATRTAGCLQVTGCTAAGVFTEADWVLDAPAAAAMVFGAGMHLHPARDETETRLTLCAPNALDLHWLHAGGPRFGGVSGDATGRGPYSVWTGARRQPSGRCQLCLRGIELRIGVSQGIHPISLPARLDQVQGHDIRIVGGDTALDSLIRELPLPIRTSEHIPTHLLLAGVTYGQREHALDEGRFHLLPVVGVNIQDASVTVAGRLQAGQELFWALRQPQAAERDMAAMLARIAAGRCDSPAFALMFPCLGRGPWFYSGEDRDIHVLVQRYPELPLIGFYGNGEIAHLDGANRLLQYSVVLGLGYAADAHV
ncbi:MAG TPA: FIST C-terminal domain-containing protein [Thiobacillaceae bacterium]|nr:FIST C-terminal domain-containing protein [Thiobacillaceae bacterium]HNU63166.1 FIST C-terminal domain-containing protein [Thiobacillaceae bacterium]